MKLLGKSALISGGSQGFGFAVARQFVLEGASVLLCGRTLAPLQQAHDELCVLAHPSAKVQFQTTDISDKNQMDSLVKTALKEFKKIDILVANAGIYGTKGAIDEIDWEEWSHAIDINLKGTVLQCRAVLPHFKKQKSGKILILSGGGATKPMPYLSAYAASKAAVVRFAETLAEEVAAFHIDVNTIAPGALNTRLLDEILVAGPKKVGEHFYTQSLKQKETGGHPLTLGASLCTFLASSESDGITGKLISAVWDPWQTFPDNIHDLKNSDIYTLRRIIPKDRGKNWGEFK